MSIFTSSYLLTQFPANTLTQYVVETGDKRALGTPPDLSPPLFFDSDLMTEMMDMSSDLVGSGIPFLDYRMYAERIFFPGHRESPLRRDLDVQECRRQTVEQGLVQLSNLLNSKLFLTKVVIFTISVIIKERYFNLSRALIWQYSLPLSSFTPWRASGLSLPETEPTWPPC